MNKKLPNIVKKIPHLPGIYKFMDKEGTVLYVGKAKNLKNRVGSYFKKNKDISIKTIKLLEKVEDISYVSTGSELEAILLETNLIKELRPKYNILMKDDKNFLYIKITTNEDFPRIYTVRKIIKDKAKYFGPKTSAEKVRQIITLIRKLFPARNCNLELIQTKEGVKVTQKTINYPCLEFHIKRCCAPCMNKCQKEDYKVLIDRIIDFLNGKSEKLMEDIKSEMQKYVAEKKFELAAKSRDKIAAIESMMEKQKITVPDLNLSQDIIGYYQDQYKGYFNLFMIREGKLIGNENFILDINDEQTATREVIESFLKFYYDQAADIPKEILVPIENLEVNLMEALLANLVNLKIRIIFPKRGKNNKLLELANKNAKNFAVFNKAKWEKEKERTEGACEELAKILQIKKEVKRMECYDISHLSGQQTVGSMVVFENGKPKNSDYRHFKLQTTEGEIDDFKSMKEVLERRLKYLGDDNKAVFKNKIIIKKIKKNEEKLMVDKIKELDLDDTDIDLANCLVIKDQKTIIGLGRLKVHHDQMSEIASLWIEEKYRHQGLAGKLIEELIHFSKQKRIYIVCYEKYRSLYEKLGFKEINVVPEFLNKKSGTLCSIDQKKVYFVYEKRKTDKSFQSKPDLIVLDGGKGQLNAGMAVLNNANLKIPIMALAKENEEIFMPNVNNSICLPNDSVVIQLLQRIRDEAHRFAITYNQNLRGKKMVTSVLDKISGLGAKSKKKLLSSFGSVYGIKEASIDDLTRKVGEKLAIKIKESL